jgi:hypothetical protein
MSASTAVRRYFAKIEKLHERLRAIEQEHSKLLQVRDNVLADIDALEASVRPMVRSALVVE